MAALLLPATSAASAALTARSYSKQAHSDQAMRSTLKSPPIVEQFSATFQRVALSWTFAADSAAAGGDVGRADASRPAV